MIEKERNLRSQTESSSRTNENQSFQISNSFENVVVDDVLLNNENEKEFENTEKNDDAREEEDAEKERSSSAFFAFVIFASSVVLAFNVRTNQINSSQKRIFEILDFESNSNQTQIEQNNTFFVDVIIIDDATQSKRFFNFKNLRRNYIEAHNQIDKHENYHLLN